GAQAPPSSATGAEDIAPTITDPAQSAPRSAQSEPSARSRLRRPDEEAASTPADANQRPAAAAPVPPDNQRTAEPSPRREAPEEATAPVSAEPTPVQDSAPPLPDRPPVAA